MCGTVCGSCLGPSWSKVCQHLYLAACVSGSVWQGASMHFFVVSVVCGAMHGWGNAWVVHAGSFMEQGKSTL